MRLRTDIVGMRKQTVTPLDGCVPLRDPHPARLTAGAPHVIAVVARPGDHGRRHRRPNRHPERRWHHDRHSLGIVGAITPGWLFRLCAIAQVTRLNLHSTGGADPGAVVTLIANRTRFHLLRYGSARFTGGL